MSRYILGFDTDALRRTSDPESLVQASFALYDTEAKALVTGHTFDFKATGRFSPDILSWLKSTPGHLDRLIKKVGRNRHRDNCIESRHMYQWLHRLSMEYDQVEAWSYPSAMDWQYVNHHLLHYVGDNPMCYQPRDVDSAGIAVFGRRWHDGLETEMLSEAIDELAELQASSHLASKDSLWDATLSALMAARVLEHSWVHQQQL
jgi:hypothetical protein